MTQCLKLLGVALCAIVTAEVAYSQDAVKLDYKFGKDTKLIYKKALKLDQSQSFMGNKIETKMHNSDIILMTFLKKDKKGNVYLQMENKGIVAEMKIGPVGEYKYDSKAKEKDTGSQLGASLTPMYDRMNGAVLTLVMAPDGKIARVEGYKEMMGDILKDNPIAAQFAAGGDEKAAALSYNQYFPEFPKKALRPGDTWTSKYEIAIPKMGKAEGKKIFNVVGMDKVGKRNTVKISVATELSFDLKMKQGGAEVSGTLSINDSKGTLQFDPKAGQIVSLDNQFTIGGQLNIAVNGQNIPVDTNQRQHITMELLPELPKE